MPRRQSSAELEAGLSWEEFAERPGLSRWTRHAACQPSGEERRRRNSPSVPKLLILSRALQLEAEQGSDLAPQVFSQQLFWGFGMEPCACRDGNPSAVGVFTCERRKAAHLPCSLCPLPCDLGHVDAAPNPQDGEVGCQKVGAPWAAGLPDGDLLAEERPSSAKPELPSVPTSQVKGRNPDIGSNQTLVGESLRHWGSA